MRPKKLTLFATGDKYSLNIEKCIGDRVVSHAASNLDLLQTVIELLQYAGDKEVEQLYQYMNWDKETCGLQLQLLKGAMIRHEEAYKECHQRLKQLEQSMKTSINPKESLSHNQGQDGNKKETGLPPEENSESRLKQRLRNRFL